MIHALHAMHLPCYLHTLGCPSYHATCTHWDVHLKMSLRHLTSIHSKQSARCYVQYQLIMVLQMFDFKGHSLANRLIVERLHSIFNIKKICCDCYLHPASFGIITQRVPDQRNQHHHHHHRAYRLQCICSPLLTISFDGISCK